MLNSGIRRYGKMDRWEKLGMTGPEVDENELGGRDNEHRYHF